MSTETVERTVVVVALSLYDDLLRSVQEIFGRDQAAAEQLGSQIREILSHALEDAEVDQEHVEIRWTEDGGIFLLDDALQASRFAAAVHHIASERNQSESFSRAQRHFRIGMATGAVSTAESGDLERGPLKIASKMKSAARTGEIVIDTATWERLSEEERESYGQQGEVVGEVGPYYYRRRKETARAPWDRSEPATAVALYVRDLQVLNVKGVEKAHLEFATRTADAPGWYVLAGGNGSGKSTLLRAIAAASVGRALERLLDDSWIRKGSDVTQVVVSYVDDAEGSRPETHSSIKLRPSESPTFGRYPKAVTLVESGYLSGYGPFKRLGGGSNYAEELTRGDSRLARVLTLFLEEAALWEVPRWLLRTDLDTNGGARKGHIVSLLNSGLLPAGFVVKDFVEDDLLIETPDGSAVSLRSTSDGLRCILAMVLDILRGLEDCFGVVEIIDGIVDYPGVVLIDEPDNHLHVLWQVNLASWMKEHFPRIQFIVASHSPFVCVAADKIWRLDDESGAIVPRELPEEEMKELWNGSVSAILESDAFRVFNTLAPEAQDRHQEYLRLHRLSLQGRRLSAEEKSRLDELEQEIMGPVIPRDPEFDKLFP